MHTPETFSIEVGRAITLLRIKRNITAKNLAQDCGVTSGELKDIEAGRFDYFLQISDGASVLLKICNQLGVQADTLVGSEGDVY
jgi:transcriptional regulator with XRE-family HTH domain